MPKLKIIGGRDAVQIFNSFNFVVVSQKGSHIKLKRITITGTKQVLTVPDHKEIDRGTLKGIINQASKYIPLAELQSRFYNI